MTSAKAKTTGKKKSATVKIKLQPQWLQWGERFAKTSLPEVLLLWALVLGRYNQNADFSYPHEMVGPLVLTALLATAVYYAYRAVLKAATTTHLAALPVVLTLYGFAVVMGQLDGFVALLLPRAIETYEVKVFMLSVLLLLASGLLALALSRLVRLPAVSSLQPMKVLVFLLLFIFVSQVGKVGLKLASFAPELRYQPATLEPTKNPNRVVSKPDIYYLVFDRYTNNTMLQQYYDYDNSAFTNFLATEGFVNRDNAYANYPFTLSSISSTLSMNYHTELGKKFGTRPHQTALPYRNILDSPPVAKILQQEGYQYNQISSWSDYTRLAKTADANPVKSFRLNILGMSYYPSDLARDVINKSILSPMLKTGIRFGNFTVVQYQNDRHPRENFNNQLAALETIATQKNNKPQFSFAHVLVPHDPYIFLADGSEATYDSNRNDNGAPETEKYLNQIKYLNTRITKLVQTIRTQSPNAVIVLQADEGSYPADFRFELTPTANYNPIKLPADKMRQKFGIQASYYLPGASEATVQREVSSSVNIFRFILSRYMGYDLPALPDCHYSAGNKYQLFDYQLVTKKLTGQPANPACQEL